MNSNTIRNVMGVHRETGSLSVNSPPILDHLSRRKSIAYTDTTISDLIRNAPWIGTVESVKEGSSVDSLTSAIALWVTATIVPKVREEVIKESELEVQEALENVKNEMNSVKEANREIMGRGSPEECKELFINRMESLKKELLEKQTLVLQVDAIQLEIDSKTSFVTNSDGTLKYVSDENHRKEKDAMSKEITTLRKTREKRHLCFVREATGNDAGVVLDAKGTEKISFPSDSCLNISYEQFFTKFTRWLQGSPEGLSFYALHPFIMRILTSFSPSEGCWWSPPHPSDVAKDAAWITAEYVDQAERLCSLMKEKWEKDWNTITDTYTYGRDGQHSVHEAFLPGDALRVIHCLVTKISDVEGDAVDSVEMLLLSAPRKFAEQHPKLACDHLSALLQKASNLNATVPFRLTAQICENLGKRNTKYLFIAEKYKSLPENTPRDKCGNLLLKLVTDIKRKAEDIDRDEGGKPGTHTARAICESSEEVRSMNEPGRNDGGGKKNFPTCRAENCNTKVCEARASKVRPYPPHPSGLCLEHFFNMIRQKPVKLKDGLYICSEKQADGSWKYSTSNSPQVREKPKKAYFLTKSEILLDTIMTLTSDGSDDGIVTESELELMVQNELELRAIGIGSSTNKRKREEVIAVEKSPQEMRSIFSSNAE